MKNLFILSIFIFIAFASKAQLTPEQVIKAMGRGINIGNTMEAPKEGDWRKPIEEYYFDDYKAAGFQTIRIPITWDEHTSNEAPYTINEDWLDRVEQVVDWGLARGLFIYINAHHEFWLKENYNNEVNQARFDSIWSQISVRFQDKSDSLFFEMLNEPKGMTVEEVDDVNERILSIIRKTNPTRLVIFSGNEWSGLGDLKKAAVPNDDYLIAYFHDYGPWPFGQKGEGTFGSESDINGRINLYEKAKAWSDTNNVPVILSEFGSIAKCDYNSRMLHYATNTDQSLAYNVAFQVWDDGGKYGIYERDNRTFNELKDILIHTHKESPVSFSVSLEGDTLVALNWKNRSAENVFTVIQRRTNSTEFASIDTIAGNLENYVDSLAYDRTDYYYKLVSNVKDSIQAQSHPLHIKVLSEKYRVQKPYNMVAAEIPGTIEGENFDDGWEGLSYHDSDDVNRYMAFRTDYAVDCEARDDGGYHVAEMLEDEWLEYTVDVEKTGDYKIVVHAASPVGGGKFTLKFRNNETPTIVIPRSGSWQTTDTVSTIMRLIEGEQTLRFSVKKTPYFNLDKIVITDVDDEVGVNEKGDEIKYKVYPNPASSYLTIENSENKALNVYILDAKGSVVKAVTVNANQNSLSLAGLSKGLHFVKILSQNKQEIQKLIIE